MNYNNIHRESNNAIIKNLYAPGYAMLTLSFFKTNLTLRFAPYTGKDNMGFSQYDTKDFLSTTIDNESAAAFYSASMSILNGSESPIQLVIPCNHNASLMFKYESDQNQNNEMRAHLIIEKDNKVIPFQFEVHSCLMKKNGQILTKTIQSGLIVFTKALEAYLMSKDSEKRKSQFVGSEPKNSQMQAAKWQP